MGNSFIVSKARAPDGRLLVLGVGKQTWTGYEMAVNELDLRSLQQQWTRRPHPSDPKAFQLKHVGISQPIALMRTLVHYGGKTSYQRVAQTHPQSLEYWYDDNVQGPYNAFALRGDWETKLNVMPNQGDYVIGGPVIGYPWDRGAANELWRSWPAIQVPTPGARIFLTNFEHIVQLGATPDGALYMHTNTQTWEIWTVEDAGGGQSFLRSAHGTYLGSRQDGTVYLTQKREAWERWAIQFGDGIRIRSTQWGLRLGSRPDGSIYTHSNMQSWERWWTPPA